MDSAYQTNHLLYNSIFVKIKISLDFGTLDLYVDQFEDQAQNLKSKTLLNDAELKKKVSIFNQI